MITKECPRCANVVVGSKNNSASDQIVKGSASKVSSSIGATVGSVIGAAIPIPGASYVTGVLGAGVGKYVNELFFDEYVQGEICYNCPKCGYSWSAEESKSIYSEQSSERICKGVKKQSVSSRPRKTVEVIAYNTEESIKQRLDMKSISCIEDCIYLLQISPKGISEVDHHYLSCVALVLMYIRSNTSQLLMDKTYSVLFQQLSTVQMAGDADMALNKKRYALLFKTIFIFTEAKLLYNKSLRSDDSVEEGLLYVSQIIYSVVNLYNSLGYEYSFVDTSLIMDQQFYKKKSRLLFSDDCLSIKDCVVIVNINDIYCVLDSILDFYSEDIKSILTYSDLNYFLNRYIDKMIQSRLLSENIRKKKIPYPELYPIYYFNSGIEIDSSTIALRLLYVVLLSLAPFGFLYLFLFLAYTIYLCTFTLIEFQDSVHNLIDSYSSVWLYPTIALGCVGVAYYGVKLIKSCIEYLQKISQNKTNKKINRQLILEWEDRCEKANEEYESKKLEVLTFNELTRERIINRFRIVPTSCELID